MVLEDDAGCDGDDAFGPCGRDLSIMIPTYNCAPYLAEALRSLERQGVDAAQIVVVDDCSTEDDPEAVVAACGMEQVTFVRQPVNLGLVGNFNSCIDRAERPWVHLLHGDDYVLPGGYQRLRAALAVVPDAVAAFGRCVIVDEASIWSRVTKRIPGDENGRMRYDPMDWRLNRYQFAGVTFRRDAALDLGGFDARYSHCADWHLWWRLARTGPAAFTNHAVGAYRSFAGSHTASLVRSADNLREALRFLDEVSAAEPAVGTELYRALFDLVLDQGTSLEGDDEAFLAHVRLLADFPSGLPRARKVGRLSVRHLKARVQGRVGHEASW